ncbi:MAG: cytochrome b/b6 domain-containing protein [Litorivicinaceae bacterium]
MSALRPVWDIWVRLGHWLIVAGVVFQQISGKELELIDAHATVGILLCGWVLFRITWGFTGPRFARFSSFPPPSPKAALNSISLLLRKEPERGPGHSAIGGIAIYLMITLIGLTALTGMTSSDDIFFSGPLAPLVSAGTVDLASRAHTVLSELVLIIVIVHVAAVLWHQIVIKERLIQGMITGLKSGPDEPTDHPHPFSKMIVIRGFFIFIACVGGAYGLLGVYLGW